MTFIPMLNKPEIVYVPSNKIVVIDNVLDSETCNKLIEFGETRVSPGVNNYKELYQIKFQACTLPIDTEIHNLLQPAWEKAANNLGIDITFVEPYELKKYVIGDFFGKHTDNYVSIAENVDRKITFSVQLSDTYQYKGGNLNIMNRSFTAKKGSAIVFPSNFSHEVKPITYGTRWSLIGWGWGPYWK